MAGHVFHFTRKAKALLLLQHPHDRERHGHQRGLGVLGQRKRLERAIEHDVGELLAEGGIDLREQRLGRTVPLGQLGPHTHRLAALPRKDERNSHWPNQVAPSSLRLDTSAALAVKAVASPAPRRKFAGELPVYRHWI